MPDPGDEEVGGLDVAMNDAFRVSCVEGARNIYRQIEQLVGGKRFSQDALAQGLPFQQFPSR